jgi:hypothetical protein
MATAALRLAAPAAAVAIATPVKAIILMDAA